jgi:hypothetical protein
MMMPAHHHHHHKPAPITYRTIERQSAAMVRYAQKLAAANKKTAGSQIPPTALQQLAQAQCMNHALTPLQEANGGLTANIITFCQKAAGIK